MFLGALYLSFFNVNLPAFLYNRKSKTQFSVGKDCGVFLIDYKMTICYVFHSADLSLIAGAIKILLKRYCITTVLVGGFFLKKIS